PGMWRLAPACPRLVKKLSLRAHRAIQSARLQRSETPVSTAVPEKVLVRSVLLAGARTLGSGRWVKGCQRRVNFDPLAASENLPPAWLCCWLVVGCWGRGDAAEVSVFEPVGVSLEGDDFGVVDESVDHRGGDYVVVEGLASPAERLVGGDDQAGPLVPGRDELEEQ